jgi:hypothetical protein
MREVGMAKSGSGRKSASSCDGGKSRNGKGGKTAGDSFINHALNVYLPQLRATSNINLEQGFGSQNGRLHAKFRPKSGRSDHNQASREQKYDEKYDYSFGSLLVAEIDCEHRVGTSLLLA